jgi:hypothetical protein
LASAEEVESDGSRYSLEFALLDEVDELEQLLKRFSPSKLELIDREDMLEYDRGVVVLAVVVA